MIHVVSLSGGKDSVALWLWARRTNRENIVAVYVDTGWEWSGHHTHLNLLEARLGPIVRLAPRRRVDTPRRGSRQAQCPRKSKCR